MELSVDIVATPGDPCGVGPEVLIKALVACGRPGRIAVPGSPELLWTLSGLTDTWEGAEEYWGRVARSVVWIPVEPPPACSNHCWHPDNAPFIDSCLQTAVDFGLATGRPVVTGPVDKHFFVSRGLEHSGHTEYLQKATSSPSVTMYFDSERIRLALMTRHVPLGMVPNLLSRELLETTVCHCIQFCKPMRSAENLASTPFAVVGLDPHCGEWGAISRHDLQVRRWVEELGQRGLPLSGPISADTAFLPDSLLAHTGFLCWYHDQGMIPVKLLGFASAVNCTLGLPFLRTSPAHGVAYGIAGTGMAKPDSMVAALDRALERARPDLRCEKIS